MLSEKLKSRIERYYEEFREVSPLFVEARAGKMTASKVERLLYNIRYLIRHTPVHLAMGLRRSRELGEEDLTAYFRDKLGEEQGHDIWADNDLKEIQKEFGAAREEWLSPKLVELVAYLGTKAGQDPAHYVAYIFLAEYFTVLSTSELLDALEANCGIPARLLSVLGNHAELDKKHVADDFRILDTPSVRLQEQGMEGVLTKAMALHGGFIAEVALGGA